MIDLTNNYQILDGTLAALVPLAKTLKRAKQSFEWVRLFYTTQQPGQYTLALKISADLYRALTGY